MIRRVLVTAMLAIAVPASAEDVVAYEAEGDAPTTAADSRVAALDDAFGKAVTAAIADLTTPEMRAARKADLDREIVGHARLWVAKFTVTRDETADDRRDLTVSVRIDRDKLRARLGELNVETRDAASGSGASTGRSVTILVRVTGGKGARASFGPGADASVPGLTALSGVFRTAGYAVRRAPSSGPAPRGDGELPVADGDAEALGEAAKADVVAVAGVAIGAPVPVRGVAHDASLVTARLHVIDRKDHKVIGDGTATAAALGDDAGYAIDRALLAAAADVLPPAPTRLAQAQGYHGDDTPVGEAGVVLVRLRSTTPYAMVLTEQKYLAGAKGVRAATLRRLSPAGWVIGVVTSDPIERVAQIAKKPPTADASTQVKIVGDVVDVTLTGAAP